MNKRKNLAFYCFSPFVMAATVFVEVALIFHILLTRKKSVATDLVVLLILFLAIFQLSEFGICENFILKDTQWGIIGFTAITMLPILGLHLVLHMLDKQNKLLLGLIYSITAAWIGIFAFGDIMQGAVCSGNYVIFDIKNPYERLYYIFYNGLVVLAMFLALFYSFKTANPQKKSALQWTFVAYLSFTLPAAIVWALTNKAGDALPSILCGFAVMLAVILTMKVLPKISEPK